MYNKNELIFAFISGVVAGALVFWGWQLFTNKENMDSTAVVVENKDEMTDEIDEAKPVVINKPILEVPASSAIVVTNQTAGASATVQKVDFTDGGWVALHEEINGSIGNALGAVRRDAGVHTDVLIPLLRATLPEKAYWIVLYHDNGDKTFSLESDFPITDTTGAPLIAQFKTTASDVVPQ